jgi:membrane-associated protease RseP (regulator of RpoE activity)
VLDDRRVRPVTVGLFAATAVSIAATGFFVHRSGRGFALLAAAMAILLAHEMGHFVACRLHRVDCTWPFFLPAPILNPFVGTLGALIVIRQRFPNRRALFDIGAAGPLSGLLACLIVFGVSTLDSPTPPPSSSNAAPASVIPMGLPLLWSPLEQLQSPAEKTGHDLNTLAVAAWFGLLLTGLNLIPIGQLDGGHILYALFPRYAHRISRIAWLCGLGLAVWRPAWLFWALLMAFVGRRPHPTTVDDAPPIGRTRRVVAVLALAVFVLTFIPEPIPITWEMFLGELAPLVRHLGLA